MNIDDNDSVQLAPEKLHLIFDSTIRSPIIGQGEHLSLLFVRKPSDYAYCAGAGQNGHIWSFALVLLHFQITKDIQRLRRLVLDMLNAGLMTNRGLRPIHNLHRWVDCEFLLPLFNKQPRMGR